MWLSNTATAAMLMPIAHAVMTEMTENRKRGRKDPLMASMQADDVKDSSEGCIQKPSILYPSIKVSTMFLTNILEHSMSDIEPATFVSNHDDVTKKVGLNQNLPIISVNTTDMVDCAPNADVKTSFDVESGHKVLAVGNGPPELSRYDQKQYKLTLYTLTLFRFYYNIGLWL